jgi:hypothetical protein
MLFVTTTDMTGSDTAVVVTTASLAFFFQQTSKRFTFMQLRCDDFNDVTTARRGRLTFYLPSLKLGKQGKE